MDYFFISLLKSPFFILLFFLIPMLNGIACFLIFRRIIIKVLVGIALALVSFITNICLYFFLFFFLHTFIVYSKDRPVGTPHPFLDTIHLIITIFICGCFTVWLYKVGIDNAEMRRQD